MALLEDIQTEITRISNDKTDINAALVEKGQEAAESLDDVADKIKAISGGGSDYGTEMSYTFFITNQYDNIKSDVFDISLLNTIRLTDLDWDANSDYPQYIYISVNTLSSAWLPDHSTIINVDAGESGGLDNAEDYMTGIKFITTTLLKGHRYLIEAIEGVSNIYYDACPVIKELLFDPGIIVPNDNSNYDQYKCRSIYFDKSEEHAVVTDSAFTVSGGYGTIESGKAAAMEDYQLNVLERGLSNYYNSKSYSALSSLVTSFVPSAGTSAYGRTLRLAGILNNSSYMTLNSVLIDDSKFSNIDFSNCSCTLICNVALIYNIDYVGFKNLDLSNITINNFEIGTSTPLIGYCYYLESITNVNVLRCNSTSTYYPFWCGSTRNCNLTTFTLKPGCPIAPLTTADVTWDLRGSSTAAYMADLDLDTLITSLEAAPNVSGYNRTLIVKPTPSDEQLIRASNVGYTLANA